MADHSLQTLWPLLEKCWQQAEFLSLSLTGPNSTPVDLPRKYLLKPVQIGSEIQVQWTAFDARKHQTHQNHSWQETLALLQQQLGHHYQSAHLKTAQEEIQIRLLPSGKLKLKRTSLKQPLPIVKPSAHNQSKQYLFPEGIPCPFLIATGIMTDSGQVRQAMYRKFRQINRFAEFVHDMHNHFPQDRPVRIVDYGCGKSYLTFAVRHLLVEVLGRQVDMLGLDTNPDVIASCLNTRDQLGWTDINFQVARIADANLQGPLDLAIWLHACDTATDEALACSVNAQAEVILAVPCCQHELHHQLQHPTLQPLLKHGILRERLAALSTDALRAQLLEAHGYQTQIMEFIDLEHTAKNLLLRATRHPSTPQQRLSSREAYLALKQELQISQFELEKCLGLPE